MAVDDVTLILRLPPDLKGSFQGLCKARGVSVSEELRRFMADSIAAAALGMTTKDLTVKSNAPVKLPTSKKNRGSSRCDDTNDLFLTAKTPSKAHTSSKGRKVVVRDKKMNRDAKTGQFVLSSLIQRPIDDSKKQNKGDL